MRPSLRKCEWSWIYWTGLLNRLSNSFEASGMRACLQLEQAHWSSEQFLLRLSEAKTRFSRMIPYLPLIELDGDAHADHWLFWLTSVGIGCGIRTRWSRWLCNPSQTYAAALNDHVSTDHKMPLIPYASAVEAPSSRKTLSTIQYFCSLRIELIRSPLQYQYHHQQQTR